MAAALMGTVVSRAADEPPVSPPDTNSEQVVVVDIAGRQFHPPEVTMHAGRRTALIFQNRDAELHAFVASDLLRGVNLNVSGNGAPEFGPEGFKRVIIPSSGRAEIRFVPERPGRYSYLCDMPGHEMKATIIVQ
jgi:plastocyanin